VTLRRRWSWAGTAIGSAVLAAVAALSGCAPAAPADAVAPAEPVLSLAQAEAAYSSYLAASDAAAVQGTKDAAAGDAVALQADKEQALNVAAYADWELVKSQFTAMANTGTPVTRYQYGKPTFYVPALASYPQWFMVAASRRAEVGGRLGAPVNAIMVFEKYTPARQWALAGSVVLNQVLPAIARNSNGYAVAVPDSDSALLLPPSVVGATQAAVVDEGPGSPAAAVVGSGPQTTGLYAALTAQARSDAAKGLQYQWLLQGASFGQFELRTADGGALVLYGMSLNTTTQHRNLAAGSPIPIAANLAALAPGEVALRSLWVNYTYEYAAIDPPPGARNAKLQVIGADGAATYTHAALALRQ
jgi:hypothetical protein